MSVTPYYDDGNVTIYHGDCRDVLPALPDESVQLVLTDPPYPEEYSYVWDTLGVQAARLLQHGGSLVTLLGHYQLPYVIEALKPLRYWWLCGMDQQPSINRLIGKQVGVSFKPALWYVKGTRRRSDNGLYPVDMRGSGGGDKRFHEWGQPVGWFQHWIEHLTRPGETILDPFMGAGTTIRAAKDCGRRVIGIELEGHYCDATVGRLAQGSLFADVEPHPAFWVENVEVQGELL